MPLLASYLCKNTRELKIERNNISKYIDCKSMAMKINFNLP